MEECSRQSKMGLNDNYGSESQTGHEVFMAFAPGFVVSLQFN